MATWPSVQNLLWDARLEPCMPRLPLTVREAKTGAPKPKSQSLRTPWRERSMFSGLMSRWMTYAAEHGPTVFWWATHQQQQQHQHIGCSAHWSAQRRWDMLQARRHSLRKRQSKAGRALLEWM